MGIISNANGIIKLNVSGKYDDQFIAFSVCPNPYCDCGESLVLVTGKESDYNDIESSDPKKILEIYVHKKLIQQLKHPGDEWYDEHESKELKNFLDENLTEEDWSKLRNHYYFLKTNLIEFEPEDHEYNYEFSAEQMNDEGLLISFHSIYPASEIFTIENDGIEYEVIDHYCKNPFCECTDINIQLFKDDEFYLDLFYSYKTKKKQESKYSWVIQKLSTKYKDLNIRFGLRNAKIRLLYSENLSERQQVKLNNMKGRIASSSKIGRNDKCPCGSGKKYKQCCMTE